MGFYAVIDGETIKLNERTSGAPASTASTPKLRKGRDYLLLFGPLPEGAMGTGLNIQRFNAEKNEYSEPTALSSYLVAVPQEPVRSQPVIKYEVRSETPSGFYRLHRFIGFNDSGTHLFAVEDDAKASATGETSSAVAPIDPATRRSLHEIALAWRAYQHDRGTLYPRDWIVAEPVSCPAEWNAESCFPLEFDRVKTILSPLPFGGPKVYLKDFPTHDHWGNPFEFIVGYTGETAQFFLVRSLGADGKRDTPKTTKPSDADQGVDEVVLSGSDPATWHDHRGAI